MRCGGGRSGHGKANDCGPPTATAGISSGHVSFAGRTGVLIGQCFHSYDDKCAAEAEMRAEG